MKTQYCVGSMDVLRAKDALTGNGVTVENSALLPRVSIEKGPPLGVVGEFLGLARPQATVEGIFVNFGQEFSVNLGPIAGRVIVKNYSAF